MSIIVSTRCAYISENNIRNLPSTPVRKKLSISNESCTAAAALAVNGLIVVAIKEAAVINDVSIICFRVD